MEKYTLNLDKDNYVLSIAHTDHDDVELNLDSLNLNYLSAYKYANGEMVLDELKKAELIAEDVAREKQEQINELTSQLEATNDDMLGFVEDLFSLKNPLTFINDMFNLMKNYTSLVAARQEIREEIKELEE